MFNVLYHMLVALVDLCHL